MLAETSNQLAGQPARPDREDRLGVLYYPAEVPELMSNDPAEKQHPWGAVFAMATVLPVVIAGLYMLARWLTEDRDGVLLKYDWEQHIPIVPAMIGPYLTLYPLIVIGVAVSRSRRDLWRLVGAMLVATLFCSIVFVLFPTFVQREGRNSTGVSGEICDMVHDLSGRNCSAPSLHVVLAGILWAHFAAILPGYWRWLAHAWFPLVILSTLLTQQHHILDALSGAAVAAISVIVWRIGRADGAEPSAKTLDQVLSAVPFAHKQQESAGTEQP